MSVTYGYKTTEPRDHFVELAEDAVERAIAAMLPGATIINTFPTCTFPFRQSQIFQVSTRLLASATSSSMAAGLRLEERSHTQVATSSRNYRCTV